MGCDSCASADEGPQHLVDITEAYKIDGTEVTADLFLACLDAGPCSYKGIAEQQQGEKQHCSLQPDEIEPGPGWKIMVPFLPMNCVNRVEAATFCEWLGKSLCSEAQWERVAVGTCSDHAESENCAIYEPPLYPWGDGVPTCDLAVFSGCGPAPVATQKQDKAVFAPAKFYPGVYGLGGNVSEWTADNYHDNYLGAPYEGTPWDTGEPVFVHRGGSYLDQSDGLRSTRRASMSKLHRSPAVGFRCCNTK